MKKIITFINDKMKAKYTVKEKGIFIKYKISQISDDPAQIYPVIKYTYNNKEYIEESSLLSDSRNWKYLKEGDIVDIYINPKRPKKFYAVIPELSPENQEKLKEDILKEKKVFIISFIIMFIIALLLVFI